MKIAPYTEKWNEGERDWSFVKDPRDEIESWQARERKILPNDYRDFMVKFNGGRVYPRLFKHNIGELRAGPYVDTSSQTYVDLIFSWKTVESHWRREVYGKGAPEDYLIIGDTPGGVQLLLSLKPGEEGQVFAWIHSTDTWGTGRNTQIFPLASSFSEFLRSLYDDRDRSDYKHWRRPIYDKLAKEFEA